MKYGDTQHKKDIWEESTLKTWTIIITPIFHRRGLDFFIRIQTQEIHLNTAFHHTNLTDCYLKLYS